MEPKDEIAKRSKRLLFGSQERYGLEDQSFYYVKLGDYDLHYDDSTGITINDRGPFHGTIFRQGTYGNFEECQPGHMPALLDALQRATVLDDLADI